MFTKTPMVPGSDKTDSKPPAKHMPPAKTEPHKGGAPVDHKAAIEKMHPEHVHKLVQDAHAGKFGPEAQKTAQSAMQQAPQAPGAPAEGSEPDYSGMFGGGGAPAQQDEDQPVSGGQMFGGR
jgi:hypothetical protein